MSKKAQDIVNSAVYDTGPDPSIIPVNQRILCVSFDPGEIRTESGLILPGQKGDPKKDGSIMSKPRFVVVAAAGDAFLIDKNGSKYRLEPGDEIYPFWPPGAIDWDFPYVFDYKTQRNYHTFHTSELAGFIKSKSVEK